MGHHSCYRQNVHELSMHISVSQRVNVWLWRRWDSADLLSFWQACFSRAAKSPFHTCQAVLCFWGIPSIFPLLLFQQHGSNPVWDIYATHHHPPLNAPSPAGFLRVWELRRHLAIQSQWVIFTLYGIASRSSS